MNTPAQETELLAPAGDWDCLRAAVANGADAVYFGLPRFNARQRAANFQPDELDKVIDYLHGHNVRGYVAFNTLIFPDELPDAAGYVRAIAAAGADAVIVQDLGLADLIHRLAPTLPIHASTQMTLAEPAGIELVRSLGISRVILARELSLAQIESVRRQTDMPVEVFVHGAMCISVSGQCQASQALFGRSANRGQCGQPCRLPYELIVDGEFPLASSPDVARPFPLSPRDLAAFDRVGRLVELGVAGLKIEGRLKGAIYVAAATAAYRAALDAALAGQPFALAPDQQRALAQTFSRGWTHGYLDGINHQELVDGRFGRSRGLFVGTVAGFTSRGVIVRIDEGDGIMSLRPGDGVVFDQGLADDREQGGRVYAVRHVADRLRRGDTGIPGRTSPRTAVRGHSVAPQGSAFLVELEFGQDDIQTSTIAVGTPVFKTDDPQLRKQLEATFSRDVVVRRAPIRVRVEAAVGRPVRVIVRDGAGRVGEAVSDAPAPRAIKHPLTVEQLAEPFSRLGNTPFEAASIELAAPADQPAADTAVMVPKSVLNDLRRRAIAALIDRRRQAARHAIIEPEGDEKCRVPSVECRVKGGLCVLARTLPQIQAVLDWRSRQSPDPLAAIYADLQDYDGMIEAIAMCRRAGVGAGLATTRIAMAAPGEDDLLERIATAGPDVVLVRNLAAMAFLRSRLPAAGLIGDQSLNVANERSAGWLLAGGLDCITPASELSPARLAAMLSAVPPGRVEVVLHHHPAMFHTQYCLLAGRRGESGRSCQICPALKLRDRTGAQMAVRCDSAGRATIFASRPISWQGHLADLRRRGVRRFRVELLAEPPDAVGPLLDSCLG